MTIGLSSACHSRNATPCEEVAAKWILLLGGRQTDAIKHIGSRCLRGRIAFEEAAQRLAVGISEELVNAEPLRMIPPRPGLREVAESLYLDSLARCSIPEAFARSVKKSFDTGGKPLLVLGEHTIPLVGIRHICVIAIGKAAVPMLDALLPYLRDLPGCDLKGVLVANERPTAVPLGFQFFAGGHPLPNRDSIRGATAALHLLESFLGVKDVLCLFLLSGGGSAMFEMPLDQNISLEDTVAFYRELVHSGASIAEINCVRKHFSAVKGGRLGIKAEGHLAYSLLVSDVPAGQLDALASGPTVPDTTTIEYCREILRSHNLLARFPPAVRRFFENPHLLETPKPEQFAAKTITLLAADDLAEITRRRAQELGYFTVIDNSCDDWEYNRAADYLVQCLRRLRRDNERVCLISSGEVTVLLPGENSDLPSQDENSKVKPGIGGRNQHFALYAATLLTPSDASTIILSAGTDGIDGNSLSAGAVVEEGLLALRGGKEDITDKRAEAELALATFDSGTFLAKSNSLIITGRTGNNLRDIRILLAQDVVER